MLLIAFLKKFVYVYEEKEGGGRKGI